MGARENVVKNMSDLSCEEFFPYATECTLYHVISGYFQGLGELLLAV